MEELKYRSEDEMKDSGVEWLGSVPREWEAKPLKYLFDYQKGKNPSNFITYNNSIPYVTTEFLRSGITDKYVNSINGLVKVKENDLLLLWDGANAGEFFTGKNGVLGSTFAKFQIKTEDNFNYMKYYAKSYEAYLRSFTIGMGIPHVNSDILKNIEFIKSTNIKEQQKIANFLDIKTSQFESIISKKEKLIQKLEEAKKSLISEVVTGKVKIVDGKMIERKKEEMKDSGVKWLSMIAKDWEVTKVKYELDFYDSKRIPLSSEERGKMINRTYRYYGASGVIDMVDSYIFDGKYILIGEDGANLYSRRTSLVFIAQGKFWVNNHAHILKAKNENNLFFMYLLESIDYHNYITGSAQPKLTQDNLAEIKLVIPLEKEQNNITNFLNTKTSKLDNIITKTKSQIQKLKEAKQSLISEAVTGKIDLRDWEIKN